MHNAALGLIITQGAMSVIMLILCAYEMLCWSGSFTKVQGCKIALIFICEVGDLLLEIAIVIVFTQLQNDYDDYRARAGDAAGIAELVQAPENTISYVCFLAFAGVCMLVDIFEIVYFLKELKSDNSIPTDDIIEDVKNPTTLCGEHLQSPEDLTDMPVFPKEWDTALARHLTREIWYKYKDKRDAHGVSFKSLIFPECKYESSGRLEAGSEDSYTTFKDLFDPIIQEEHNHKPTDSHVSNMNADELVCPPFSETEAALIKSISILVKRNLKDLPFYTGISNEQRDEIMKRVVEIFNKFTGDLEGQFHALEGMTDDVQKNIIIGH